MPLTVDAYLRLPDDLHERAVKARIPVVDENGNQLPRCDGCHLVVCGWTPYFNAGCVDRPSGLFFCGNCAAERNFDPPERAVWTRYELLGRAPHSTSSGGE